MQALNYEQCQLKRFTVNQVELDTDIDQFRFSAKALSPENSTYLVVGLHGLSS